ncbi:TatD family hydrolase [Candidatus Micrarchaeota archaeon]|nr:TatD family hydrolase [Candidatus Micrarchaeota archaeon]
MRFIDAHCHLDHDSFGTGADLTPIIARMRQSNTMAITHGTHAASNKAQLDLVARYPDVLRAACGLDPFHAANEDLDAHLAFLEAAHTAKKLAAIGEIGLDLHYFGPETLARQRDVFEAQLAFGEKKGLACVIHTRKAVDEVLDTLPSFKGIHVLHFFLEKKHAAKALERGCYLSLPTVKSKDRTTIIKMAPLDRLLCETDSPYGWKSGTGTGGDGKSERNEPSNVHEVYDHIAPTQNKDLKDVQEQIALNYGKVFQT